MNKHFEDARYYLKRAGETAKKGVEEEIEPLRERIQSLAGETEQEPEVSRVDELREDLSDLQKRAEGKAKEAIGDAREEVKTYRNKLSE